jgi:ribosomal protein S12 methylthiotransferase accessory factor
MPAFSQRLLDVYDALVQPGTGVVRRVVDLPLQPDEARLFIAAATCTDPAYFQANRQATRSNYRALANGAGFTREECLWSVLGEACERYASGICFPDELLVASWNAVKQDALPLDALILFDDSQYGQPAFPWQPLDAQAPMRWAEGFSLVDRRPVLVPAVMAWMGYTPDLAGEHFLPQISTGQGAGSTPEQAILAGLNEVIERDSFACAWLLRHVRGRLPKPAIQAALPPAAADLLQLPGLDTQVYDISTDLGVACKLAVLSTQRSGSIAVGAAAHLCSLVALTKAVVEAHHTRNWTIDLERQGDTVPPQGISDFKHHVLHHLDPAHAHQRQFLLDAPLAALAPSQQAGSTADQLAATVGLLAQAGYAPVCVDTTPADLQSIGITTAKVIVPGLQPLHVGTGTEHRDPRRLQRVARDWGLPWPRTLNTDPHPFP